MLSRVLRRLSMAGRLPGVSMRVKRPASRSGPCCAPVRRSGSGDSDRPAAPRGARRPHQRLTGLRRPHARSPPQGRTETASPSRGRPTFLVSSAVAESAAPVGKRLQQALEKHQDQEGHASCISGQDVLRPSFNGVRAAVGNAAQLPLRGHPRPERVVTCEEVFGLSPHVRTRGRVRPRAGRGHSGGGESGGHQVPLLPGALE